MRESGLPPDLTLVQQSIWGSTTWEPLEELQSDHLPIKIEWSRRDQRERRMERRMVLDTRKTDCSMYTRLVEERMREMREERDCRRKYGLLLSVMREAAEEATPRRAVGARKSRWETREIRGARRERNKLRKDQNSNREDWVRKSRKLHETTVAAKRKIWRKDCKPSQKLETSRRPGTW